jgi:hypothetical protein
MTKFASIMSRSWVTLIFSEELFWLIIIQLKADYFLSSYLCWIKLTEFGRSNWYKMRILISCCLSNTLNILIHLHNEILHNPIERQLPNFLRICFAYISLHLLIKAKCEHPNLLDGFYAIDPHIFIWYLSSSSYQNLIFYRISTLPQNNFRMDNSTFFRVHLSNHFESCLKIYYHF